MPPSYIYLKYHLWQLVQKKNKKKKNNWHAHLLKTWKKSFDCLPIYASHNFTCVYQGFPQPLALQQKQPNPSMLHYALHPKERFFSVQKHKAVAVLPDVVSLISLVTCCTTLQDFPCSSLMN